jgi:anion-transporting  ArsA/GET3 family ATPase
LTLKFIEAVVGVYVLYDVWRFFSDFEEVSDALKERANRTYRLLKSSTSAFVIITGLNQKSIHDTIQLHEILSSNNYNPEAVIANRIHQDGENSHLAEKIYKLLGEESELADKLINNYKNYQTVIGSELDGLKKLKARFKCVSVPDLEGDVSNLRHLFELRKYLFSEI